MNYNNLLDILNQVTKFEKGLLILLQYYLFHYFKEPLYLAKD